MPEPKLRYHLEQFPIDSLAQWLPKDFAWKGRLNADLQLDLPPAARTARSASMPAAARCACVRRTSGWTSRTRP